MPARALPAVDQPSEHLARIFKDGTRTLTKRIHELESAGRSTAHAQAALRSSMLEIRKMRLASDGWIRENVPAQYRKGWTKAFDSTMYQTPAGFGGAVKYENFAMINARAVEQVAMSMKNRMDAALLQVGRQVNDVYRAASLDRIAQRLITGETIRETSKGLAADIYQRTGVPHFTDAAGRRWKLDNYATMVARTTTREATTMGTLARAKAGGYTLIQLSEHHPTCELCAPLQGLVYTMDRNDKRYPQWQNDYCPVHPNCLHVAHVYIDKFDSNREKTLKRSQAFDPNRDPRPLAERRAYNMIQKGNQKQNALRNQFANYQARLGNGAGTIQNFARAKNAGGAKWRGLQEAYRQAGRAKVGQGKAGLGQVQSSGLRSVARQVPAPPPGAPAPPAPKIAPKKAPPKTVTRKKVDTSKYKHPREEDLKRPINKMWNNFSAPDHHAAGSYIRTGKSFTLNEYLYTGRYAADKAAGVSSFRITEIERFSKLINKHKLPIDIRTTRFTGNGTADYIGKKIGVKGNLGAMPVEDAAAALNKKAGTRYVNESFTSTSFDPEKNVFKYQPVQIDILADKGQTGLITQNWDESEVVFNMNSTYEIVSATVAHRTVLGETLPRLNIILKLIN